MGHSFQIVGGSERGGMWASKTGLEKALLVLVALLSVVVAALAITVAVKNGDGSDGSVNPLLGPARQNDPDQDEDIRKRLMESIDPNKIRDNLRRLTETVHVAGTQSELDTLQWLKETYEATGLDSVEYAEYEVALGFPDYDKADTIHRLDDTGGLGQLISDGTVKYTGPPEAVAEMEKDPRAKNLWLAWAKDGTVSGEMAYANYGRLEDFDAGEKAGLNYTGKICLVRYGKLFRGSKVKEANIRGCVGAIIYSDFGDEGNGTQTDVWPNGFWIPPTAAQRGSTKVFAGEPLSPLVPAKPYAFRSETIEESREKLRLPDIPATPIGWAAATKIFNALDGDVKDLPEDFKGGNPDTVYRLTGSAKFQLSVHSSINEKSKIRNVIGKMYGSEEPDRWILLTNHVDAWTYGSQDPNSATAIITEVARAFMDAHRATGWRPRRSIMFVSVDAEEHGLIGSTEWVEEMVKLLQIRAVGLLNCDLAVYGNTSLDANVVPLMYKTIVDAAKLVANPNRDELATGVETVYDSWMKNRDPANTTRTFLPASKGYPVMGIPDSGSDHAPFLNYAGVPCVDFFFRCYPRDCYALYHTAMEISWTVENLVDKDFHFSKATGQLWSEMARSLADSLVVPFGVSDYGATLKMFATGVKKSLAEAGFDKRIPDFNFYLDSLADAAERFATAADKLQALVDDGNSGTRSLTVAQTQMVNDRLINIERAFLTDRGIPGRPASRHVVFAPSALNGYLGVNFAGIGDAARAYEAAKTDEDRAAALKTLRIALTQVQYGLESATLLLALDGMPE